MPACGMHMLFGNEVEKKYYQSFLGQLLKKHHGIYLLGSQGPDIFFYNVFMLFGGKQKNMGSRMHESRVNQFFSAMLQIMAKERNEENFEIQFAYILGFTTHYALDAGLHPYVYARTEEAMQKRGKTMSALGYHQRIEAVMDKKMVWCKKKIRPSSFILNERIKITGKQKAVIAKLLSKSMTEVYQIKVSEDNIRGSLLATHLIFSQLCTHFDMKRKLFRKVERPLFHDGLLSNLMVSDYLPDTMDAMNEKKREWVNGTSKVASHESVEELYEKTLTQYREISISMLKLYEEIQLARELERENPWMEDQRRLCGQVRNQMQETLLVLGNKSYHSGETI